ncbi:MAG: Ion-translocating oxidoreductase complex subunit B [Syntrophus sp. SKADARSKE-3]|nr:Ion-translocating oxidoreductase complex subunit B [Syntrophus sp. SKADARSKE-3]
MDNGVYEVLRRHLDALPMGFPKTESGVEIKLLKKLFTREEAEMACKMTSKPETAEQVAQRLNRDTREIADFLYAMSRKGLLMRYKSGGNILYMSAMFIVGIFEYQVGKLDQEFVELSHQYSKEAMHREMIAADTLQLRVVPVNESLDAAIEIAPYDELRQILASQKIIALAECICRKMSSVAGKPCHAPLESCLVFGTMAEFYVENGIARQITLDEAFEVLKRNEAAGLVPNPVNAQKVGGMCSCCACCCELLKAIKLDTHPSRKVKSNYFARIAGDVCTGCEICLERCQMEAITIHDEVAVINLDRCVGCGLCVTTCPTGALSLVKKLPEELYTPPERPFETYKRIAIERGKM